MRATKLYLAVGIIKEFLPIVLLEGSHPVGVDRKAKEQRTVPKMCFGIYIELYLMVNSHRNFLRL